MQGDFRDRYLILVIRMPGLTVNIARTLAAPPAVEFVALTKRFGNLVANDAVSFSIPAGTIHGIVGENGAGKSTLMSALFGLYKPDAGQIKINGKAVEIDSPHAAIRQGIGMVHQHFMLVERLTALQNIILGAEPSFWLLGGVGRSRRRVGCGKSISRPVRPS